MRRERSIYDNIYVVAMKLRLLEEKDAPLMLEWMHDQSVVRDLKADFMKKTLADCESFIREAQYTKENLHMALVNNEDAYLGTVSLKHIDGTSAEFGIVVRKTAMGQGYAGNAMREILRIAFEKLQLKNVFWCVDRRNERAVRFYDKNGYQRVDGKLLKNCGTYTEEEIKSYLWYQAEKTGK